MSYFELFYNFFVDLLQCNNSTFITNNIDVLACVFSLVMITATLVLCVYIVVSMFNVILK